MILKPIPVSEITEGLEFKESISQRNFRKATRIVDWKPGDTEHLRGKRLIIKEDCRQLLIPIESVVFIPA